MTPEAKELEIRRPQWVAPSVPLPITTDEDYAAVARGLQEVKEFQKRVMHFFQDMKQKAHEAWKSVVAKEKETLELPSAFEQACKRAMNDYAAEQERKRREEQARLEAEARRLAEEERAREAERLAQEAEAEQDDAKMEEAVTMLDRPIETPVVTLPKATPKVSGISRRDNWSAVVVDFRALVQYVAQNPSFLGLLAPDQKALNQMARSLKDRMAIPGVKPHNEPVVASR